MGERELVGVAEGVSLPQGEGESVLVALEQRLPPPTGVPVGVSVMERVGVGVLEREGQEVEEGVEPVLGVAPALAVQPVP